MAWIRDAVGLLLSAAALAVVSILAKNFACPLLFPHSSRGLRLEGAIPAEEKKEDEEEAYETAEEENNDKDEGDEAAEGKTEKKEEDEERDIGKEEKKEDEEGGIAWILSALNSFQAYYSSPAPTPSPPNVFKKFDLLKLNDDVYELCKPSGRPSVEIVFFHGFQLGGSRQTYATTWLSLNGSELWPNWIKKSVPEVCILLVSYDGSITKKDDRGGTDMYVTSENLVQSLTSTAAHVGQDGCPVILVGHSLGGLVIKEILLEANKVLSFDKPENPNWPVRDFFENVKQLFYYSCPHNGTRLADDKRVSPKGELFELLTTLNKKAARRNEEFRKLRERYEWGAYSIAEKLPADLGSLGKQVVVLEASARHDTGGYYTANADHFSVCRPASDTDSSFSKLREIIDCTRREVVCGHQKETPTTLVGDDQITQVTTKLKRTQYLSICGIGGIGKSTLAKAVYNAISSNFEYTSFVSEVKTKLVGKEVSSENLQEEILKNLYYKGNKFEHKWDRLRGKRVLIILDDVENESQVFVMPKTDGGVRFFSDQSRVLVTCRNRSIVSSKDFAVHDAQFLGKAASRKLFCSHAFKEDNAPGPYKDDVEKFVGKCGGLTLALEVAGKFLYTRRDKAMWNGAFHRLSAAQSLGGSKKEDRLWSIFEVIYEDLQEEEQQMFLDIATCFHGDKKETANLVWRCCDWVTTTDVGWKNLVDIGFVTEKEEDHGYIPFVPLRAEIAYLRDNIWMHELLCDFGRRKANPGGIESYSRVCCYPDSNGLPPWPFKEGTTPLVKFLRIAAPATHDRHIDIERLRGLENLKVLFLESVDLYGAFNLLPDKLEVLIMRRCTWTLGSSKSLYDAEDHDHIPTDGWRSTLGESSAPKSGQHDSLRHMVFLPDHYGDPVFPDQSFEHLPALKYLRISVDTWGSSTRTPQGDPRVSLPDSLKQLTSLRELDICWQSLTHLPESLGQLGSLQKFAIGSKTLTCLPESLGQLRSLQELEIDCCSLTRLPDSLGQLKSLRELGIDCSSLTRLPDSLGQLRSLQKLVMICSSLTHLSDSLGQLRSLQKLEICSSSLTCLPDSLKQLGCLELLEISFCFGLTALPDSLGHLGGLRELKIEYCKGLTALPDSLGQLGGLRELSIEHCYGLTALPDSLGHLGGLRELKIRYCKGLTALPDSLGHLGGLERLVIQECEGLETLPDALGDLHALQHLEVTDCRKLKNLPDTVTKLPCVKIFERNFMDETNSDSVDNLDSSDETDSDSVDNLDSSEFYRILLQG